MKGCGNQKRRGMKKLAYMCGYALVLASVVMLTLCAAACSGIVPESTSTQTPAKSASNAALPQVISTKTASPAPAVNTPKVSPAAVSAAPEPSETVSWREKFADKFTDGEPEQTKTSYKSENISVTVTKFHDNLVAYFVADIYIAELKYFRTAFPGNSERMGGRAFTDKIARETDAIIAINGDHCVDNPGTIVRNGRIYRIEEAGDVLVMTWDGSMQTYGKGELDLDKLESEGAYQVWTFGPMLLKDGQPMTEFNLPDDIAGLHPRTAIGYYEPGHYCFVAVDGRQDWYSKGMKIQELSQLMYDLECKVAFNLDGGRSTEMVFMGKTINKPCDGNRSTNDIVYIGE